MSAEMSESSELIYENGALTSLAMERGLGLAVTTQTGHGVHWPNYLHRFKARTFCGKVWTDLAPDTSFAAVTCQPCRDGARVHFAPSNEAGKSA